MTTIWADHALTDAGWQRGVSITIDGDGRITGLTAGADAEGTRYDCLLAAPVNAHSHGFQRAMAGLAERRGPDPRDTFWTWRKLMYRFMDTLTPDQVEAIAAFVQMEMLEARLCHQCGVSLSPPPKGRHALCRPRRTVGADRGGGADRPGSASPCCPCITSSAAATAGPWGKGKSVSATTATVMPDCARAHANTSRTGRPTGVFGVAPHSLRAVAPEDLKQAAGLAPDGPVHMHLAEQIPEVEEVQAAWGARPVEWALDNLDLDQPLEPCSLYTDADA